jgi:hypothetical protein
MHEWWDGGKYAKAGGGGAILFAVIGAVIAAIYAPEGERFGRAGWGFAIGAFVGAFAGAPVAAWLFS